MMCTIIWRYFFLLSSKLRRVCGTPFPMFHMDGPLLGEWFDQSWSRNRHLASMGECMVPLESTSRIFYIMISICRGNMERTSLASRSAWGGCGRQCKQWPDLVRRSSSPADWRALVRVASMKNQPSSFFMFHSKTNTQISKNGFQVFQATECERAEIEPTSDSPGCNIISTFHPFPSFESIRSHSMKRIP